MMNYPTLDDFILLLPLALAGAIMLGSIPVASKFKLTSLRIMGAVLGALFGLIFIEGLPALM
ncbi:hypothetical protein [Mycoavidus cysteinexigens]|nr:hypothetical protein [Mycoavidus cysteinexigens]